MRRHIPIFLLAVFVVVVPLLVRSGATTTGNSVRVDFEGTHELSRSDSSARTDSPYVAGASTRIDFEGTHDLGATSKGKGGPKADATVEGPYTAGPSERVDFEGTHPPK